MIDEDPSVKLKLVSAAPAGKAILLSEEAPAKFAAALLKNKWKVPPGSERWWDGGDAFLSMEDALIASLQPRVRGWLRTEFYVAIGGIAGLVYTTQPEKVVELLGAGSLKELVQTAAPMILGGVVLYYKNARAKTSRGEEP